MIMMKQHTRRRKKRGQQLPKQQQPRTLMNYYDSFSVLLPLLLVCFCCFHNDQLLLLLPVCLALTTTPSPPPTTTIAVFGGSGFVGRRVCKQLVSTATQQDIRVISISRTGRPPEYYCDGNWADKVEWIQADLLEKDTLADLPTSEITAAISLVGNVEPTEEWRGFFGLAFDDEKLRRENGDANKNIIEIAHQAGAQRFVFVSVSYEVAKAFEGPIEGYLDGKRQTERVACEVFGEDNTIVLGPSLIYGGNRFPKLGRLYRSIVESSLAQNYLKSQQFIRNLSVAPLQDWVEQSIFSPPIDVGVVSNVICAAALGQITRNTIGVEAQRKQGFYDKQGKPVIYPDVIYLDGTKEIECVSSAVSLEPLDNNNALVAANAKSQQQQQQPFAEGGADNLSTYLRPIPVVVFFAYVFWGIATQQFVQIKQ